MPRQLTIAPPTSSAPFRSSYLTIPPTPFSPRWPISPLTKSPSSTSHCDAQQRLHAVLSDRANRVRAMISLLPPPPNPLHWLWQCHKCNRVYKLGVTRRCLDDGHLFCAGVTTTRGKNRRAKRHQACASEFDYSGWKSWGIWTREIKEQVEAAEALIWAEGIMDGIFEREEDFDKARKYWEKNDVAPRKKDCWDKCDYPSQCRWGKQFGVKTPELPSMPTMIAPSATSKYDASSDSCGSTTPALTFEEILGIDNHNADLSDPQLATYLEPLTTPNSPSNSCGADIKDITESETHIPSIEQLVKSAKRRKNKSQSGIPLIPSPLAANPPSPEEDKQQTSGGKGAANTKIKRAVDDFEIDLVSRRGLDLSGLQMRADEFVRSLKASVGARFQV